MSGASPAAVPISRFAPTASGRAHPGTLLAGLLAWLDARSSGARFVLRIEDLDPDRCSRALGEALIADLRWFGLEWDALEWQSEHGDRHAAALDRLAALGVLYPCALSRSELRRLGRQAADGSWMSDGRHRGAPLPPGGWRTCDQPLRVVMPESVVSPASDDETPLAQNPAQAMGDPVVRRRDGVVSYHLACVVDDAAAGVTRIVRGRDLAPATATQQHLRELLGLPHPVHRHHLLVLEPHGGKLAKSHGAIHAGQLAERMTAAQLCGRLALACGLAGEAEPVAPQALLPGFSWDRVRRQDVVLDVTMRPMSSA